MTTAATDNSKLENDLWQAADNLRANSKLTSSDYFMAVLGVIFLRHAANRFDAATAQIAAEHAAGTMPKRPLQPADYVRRRALWLPENARFDHIMAFASADDGAAGVDLPRRVTDAMEAIEASFEPLNGVLPKDYGIFENDVLEDLLRLFNSDQIKKATGDVFGRIYEYFLAKFSIQKAHDNGEFFTPSSIVQTIVNIIEPDHGTVFDPACGSGGMFVQSSHFIEHEGTDTARSVVFYGQEKNRDTIRIAKMNLAVHGLEGKIAEAITCYQDDHALVGKCDYVMANPPFNVDLVDAKKVEGDVRLPFGLPGVNKASKVSNGNYLWISYFWSYLAPKGRAGFVMSSQASSASHGEKEVRRKLVETGDVDVMAAIRGNFFYTRSVPCELWHFDRDKPPGRKDQVLMLDARNTYRKVTRKIYDFAPEQMKNLSAVVWLYRGQRDRYLELVRSYISEVCREAGRASGFTRIAGLRAAVDASYTSDQAKRRFQIIARQVFARFKALLVEPSVYTFAEWHDNIAAIYRKLEERRDNADVTDVLKALHRIVNEAIRAQKPGEDHAEGLTVDLSKIDFEKLRDEFAAKVKHKRAALKDIRELVAAKLARMLAVDPLRMDFYRKYQEIVADYNREKDRTTVEATFAALVELAAGLDAEQRRAAEEGPTDTEMALFKLLFKDSITKVQREKLKQASKSLLTSLKECLASMEDWIKNAATQAEVRIRIVDTLWTELPMPPFTESETDAIADQIYDYVWARSTAEPEWMAA